MKFCGFCRTTNENEAKWCLKCGKSIIKDPILRGAGDFNNDFGERYGKALHRRHRWGNLKITIAVSTLIHIILFGGIGFMQSWKLLFFVAVGILVTLILHKTRLGHISAILIMTTVDFIGAALMGVFDGMVGFIPFILALWMVSFWYVFLGYQLKMNNDLHR